MNNTPQESAFLDAIWTKAINRMKIIAITLGVAIAILLPGCASVPVPLAPVGPNPVFQATTASTGQLQVFSALEEHTEGSDSDWYQHTDYSIWSKQGTLVKRVDNTIGHYAQEPRLMPLPVGSYLVRARAKDYLLVEVPVVIQGGETTRVYLDDSWVLPERLPKAEITYTPDGFPVGWRKQQTSENK